MIVAILSLRHMSKNGGNSSFLCVVRYNQYDWLVQGQLELFILKIGAQQDL